LHCRKPLNDELPPWVPLAAALGRQCSGELGNRVKTTSAGARTELDPSSSAGMSTSASTGVPKRTPVAPGAGDMLLIDSTNFTTLFGGTESLERFWRNMAEMRGG